MKTYEYILNEDPRYSALTTKEWIKMYNSAVAEILFLRYRNDKLHQEIDMLYKAYDEISDELYG